MKLGSFTSLWCNGGKEMYKKAWCTWFLAPGEQGMAQWWERSPPTGVARFQIPPSTPYVGWGLLLVFSLAPTGFSPRTPVFPSPQNPTLPNSNSTRNQAETKNHLVDVLPPNHYLLFMHVQKFCFTNPIRFLCRSRCCRRCSVLVEPPSSRLNKMSHSESLSSVDSHDSEWNFIPGVAPNIRAKRLRRSWKLWHKLQQSGAELRTMLQNTSLFYSTQGTIYTMARHCSKIPFRLSHNTP